jgi:hypothetical protein
MIEPTKSSSHQIDIVAYHRMKRIFLNLKDLKTEDPDQIQICEFRGQDFELATD